MTHRGKIIEVYGLWLIDLACIWGAFLLATVIRHPGLVGMEDMTVHYQVGAFFLVFCTVYNFIFDWNHDFMKRRFNREMAAILQYMALMILTVSVVMLFLKWADIFSRLILVYFGFLCFAITLLVHMLAKNIFRAYYSSDKTATKLMVVCEQAIITDTLERLGREMEPHYQIAAIAVPDSDRGSLPDYGIPFFTDMDDLHDAATGMTLDEVFIHAPTMTQQRVRDLVRGFDEMGIVCHYGLSLSDRGLHMHSLGTFARSYTVVSHYPVLKSHKRLLVKRLMDIVGGIIGIFVMIVFFPFAALAIRVESPGPIFFSQTRIGRNGRRFKIYKFRSMYRDAEERKGELVARNEMDGLMFKVTDDPRITRVGRVLRRFSIDELPQFFNILKGDMSLVGTRPPTEDEFDKYSHHYRRRLSMTPGLSGLWQISGRSDIFDFDEVVRYDLKYIDEWTLWLDVKILLKTIVVVFAGKGSK